jgi:hypothetical protein
MPNGTDDVRGQANEDDDANTGEHAGDEEEQESSDLAGV